MSSQIFIFPPSPQSIFLSAPTYLFTDSSDRLPTSSVRLGGGGGGLLLLPPSRTSASAVHHVLSPTNGNSSSATVSYAAPVVLSLRVLPGAITSVPFPVSSVGTLIAAPIKFSLL